MTCHTIRSTGRTMLGSYQSQVNDRRNLRSDCSPQVDLCGWIDNHEIRSGREIRLTTPIQKGKNSPVGGLLPNRDCNSLIEERFSAWQTIGLKLGFHSPADELRKAQIPAQSCLSGRGGKVSSRARLRRQRSQEHSTRRGSTWPHVGHMYSPRKLFVIFWKLNPAIMQ